MASRGELKIKDILETNNISFEQEYSFSDLKSMRGGFLRFDFAVFDDNGDIDFLIEYQGIQHYIPKEKFGGAFGLKKQQSYDDKKREYCKKHGIPLLEIPYWMEAKITYDYIITKAEEAIEKIERGEAR